MFLHGPKNYLYLGYADCGLLSWPHCSQVVSPEYWLSLDVRLIIIFILSTEKPDIISEKILQTISREHAEHMTEQERFIDNGDGTITDTRYNMMWLKQDSYQAKGKWCTWKGANKFTQKLNDEKFAGFDDWRLPKKPRHATSMSMKVKTLTSTETSSIST